MLIRKVTPNCINLIKYYEGCYYEPYLCPAGYSTILIGHLIRQGEDWRNLLVLGEEEVLRRDLIQSEKSVLRLIRVPLEDFQFDALVSFVFNCGGGNLQASTLRSRLNRKEYIGAAEEFSKWCYANGKKLRGLLRRRLTEKELFLNGNLLFM